MNFTAIATINGNNTTNLLHTYNYTDIIIKQNAITFYRLKQVDNNGNYFYSTITHVNAKNSLISIFPNPVKDILNVIGNVPTKSIIIYDVFGQKVLSKSDLRHINVSMLPEGIYFISTQTDRGTITYMFSKK